MKKQTASANSNNSRRNASSAPNNSNNSNNTNNNPPQELYQNLVTDYGFKTVFTKKHFLISFLNEILQGHEKITSIEYLNPHRLGKNAKERSVIFDIHCRNDKGELILLEMQNYHQKNFNARALFYGCHLIREQGVKGVWDFDYKAVYVIGILNYVDKKSRDIDSPVRSAQVQFTDNKEQFIDKLNFFLVYLPKFTKRADELETPLDYWLHALTHSQPERQINEKLLRGDKLFAELLDTIDLNKLNKSEMKKYRASKLTFEDVRPFMTGHYADGVEDGIQQGMERGILKGKQEGMQEGLQQGVQQGMQQTALNALKMGLSLQDVSKITNLPISELEEIKSRL